jgi:hypothetical protein
MKEQWREFVSTMISSGFDPKFQRNPAELATGSVYPASFHIADQCGVFLARVNGEKSLIAVAQAHSKLFDEIQALESCTIDSKAVKIAKLSSGNAEVLRKNFPFMKPVAFGRSSFSLGLGDRLGLASPGHLQCLAGTGIRPVLAQQSIRELTLTERTYNNVLDAASWAVLQEGFHDGFGADGDHLKRPEDIKMALDLGYSMITLDCSEKIDGSIAAMSAAERAAKYQTLPADFRAKMEQFYLGKTFPVGTLSVHFDQESLQEILLTYGETLAFIQQIDAQFIKPHHQPVDFELSIDETATPTTPAAHYFMASEMEKAGIVLCSLAPRFIGEFQKAIDYIGDLAVFEADFAVHAAIADHFGYRLSIHSGSDKFSVFPIIGQYTKGRVHVKTAGTNWLEALRVVCRQEPQFFRELCLFARSRFADATKFYHVTTDLAKIPDVPTLPDSELERMLNEPDARQLLHITYGYILADKNADGTPLYRTRLYKLWDCYEAEYAHVLASHIGNHVKLLKQKI